MGGADYYAQRNDQTMRKVRECYAVEPATEQESYYLKQDPR